MNDTVTPPLRFSLPVAPRCEARPDGPRTPRCDVYASNVLIAYGGLHTYCRLHIEGAYNGAMHDHERYAQIDGVKK